MEDRRDREENGPPPIRPWGEKAEPPVQGVDPSSCYGCRKCSNGCPVTFAMDLLPHEMARLLQLGQTAEVLRSRSIWICAACHTCLTRCPNNIDLPGLLDGLKERAVRENLPVEEKRTLLFHRLFLREVAARGRVFEASLMGRYQMATGSLLGPEAMANARLGWAMLRRGRLRLTPTRVRRKGWLKALFKEKRP